MIVRRMALLCFLSILPMVIAGCARSEIAGGITKTCCSAPSKMDISVVGEKLIVSNNAVDLVTYQKEPMANPVGGDMFKGSNFFHPLKTPSGFVITELQPQKHPHHLGLWWPWKYIMIDERKVLFWEMQHGEGIVEAQGVTDYKADKESASFTAKSDYLDRTAPNGPEVVLNEKIEVSISNMIQSPAPGYYLDIAITHCCATEKPIEIATHTYSGFTIRGTGAWNKDNCTILTSQGIGWDGSNFTRADWVRVEGDAGNGSKAGFVMMSCPQNRDTPQLLRTWDKQTDNEIFINFNPVQEKPWQFEPGREYTQKYRVFIYDGSVDLKETRQIWADYAAEFK